MAETYFNFSRSLKESERPADLHGVDLEKYEADLDDAAYPFEEKAIKLHEKNMEMLHAGVFDDWTKKSLSRLTDMVPGRYAKNEMSSGVIGAIDTYVYRTPLSQALIQAASNAATTPSNASPTPGNTGTTPSNASAAPSNNGTTSTNASPTPGNAGTTPSNAGAKPSNAATTSSNASTKPGNNGTTPSKDSTAPANNGTTPGDATTPSNPDQTARSKPDQTTPNRLDQTTHPASVAANDGVVKNASPH